MKRMKGLKTFILMRNCTILVLLPCCGDHLNGGQWQPTLRHHTMVNILQCRGKVHHYFFLWLTPSTLWDSTHNPYFLLENNQGTLPTDFLHAVVLYLPLVLPSWQQPLGLFQSSFGTFLSQLLTFTNS